MAPSFTGVTDIEDIRIIFFPNQLNNLKKSLFICQQKVPPAESASGIS